LVNEADPYAASQSANAPDGDAQGSAADQDQIARLSTAVAEPQAPQAPKHTRMIALINQKGGVGKTTTTVNLGAALCEQGKRVLMIDLDPQAHMSLHLGLDPNDIEDTVYDLMIDPEVSAFDVAVQHQPNMVVLPADVNLAGVERELAEEVRQGRAQRLLADKCDSILHNFGFDFVLIDCPPSLGLLTINALSLAREVVVPMQAHFLALQGLSKLLETVELVRRKLNPELGVSGVALCMHEAQTVLAQDIRQNLTEFLEAAREGDTPWSRALVMEPPIRRNIKLAEAPSFGQTIFQYAAACPGAQDYLRLASFLSECTGPQATASPAQTQSQADQTDPPATQADS
jgi:chromosome partitioning protein